MKDLIFSVFPNENFVDLGLFQFGMERCAPSHSFGPASRNHFLFHYVVSGMGTLMADNAKGQTVTYNVRSMQGFMIFPGQVTMYIADHQTPWEYLWIEFDGLRAKGMLEAAGFSLDSPIYHARKKELREEMKSEMLHIIEHGDAPPFHLIGHLYLFLDYLVRSAAAESREQQHVAGFLHSRGAGIHRAQLPEQHFSGGYCCGLRTEPHLLRQDLQGLHRKDTAGISAQLPHGKGGGTAQADLPLHRRHRKCRGLPERPAFFQSL